MRQRILDLLMAGEHPATALADLVVAQMPLPDTAAAVFHVSDSQGVRCWRAPATSLSVRRNCAAVGSTLIHLRPREEDDSRTSLCESRSSKVDEWAASNMSWHRSLWDSIGSLVGWIDGRIGARTVSANSFAAAYVCGAHLAYDGIPKPPRRTGRLIRACSMARCTSSREGPRDRIWCTQFRSRESRRSHKTVRSAEYRDRWRWRRLCCTEMRRRSKACCFGRLGSRSMSFRSSLMCSSRKACLAVWGPTQSPIGD